MASSYLTGLSACAGLRIILADSAVSMDMTGAIITSLIGTAADHFQAGSVSAIIFRRRHRPGVLYAYGPS